MLSLVWSVIFSFLSCIILCCCSCMAPKPVEILFICSQKCRKWSVVDLQAQRSQNFGSLFFSVCVKLNFTSYSRHWKRDVCFWSFLLNFPSESALVNLTPEKELQSDTPATFTPSQCYSDFNKKFSDNILSQKLSITVIIIKLYAA